MNPTVTESVHDWLPASAWKIYYAKIDNQIEDSWRDKSNPEKNIYRTKINKQSKARKID